MNVDVDPEDRKPIRRALLDLGFERVEFTGDDGSGAYSETFIRPRENGEDAVTISWSAKVEPKETREDYMRRTTGAVSHYIGCAGPHPGRGCSKD